MARIVYGNAETLISFLKFAILKMVKRSKIEIKDMRVTLADVQERMSIRFVEIIISRKNLANRFFIKHIKIVGN